MRSRSTTAWLLGALAAIALVSCGGGGGGSKTHDSASKVILTKLKVAMNREQVKKQLGDPDSKVNSATNFGAEFWEYDTTDGIVAVTFVSGRVTSFRAIGKNGGAPTGPPGAGATAPDPAPGAGGTNSEPGY